MKPKQASEATLIELNTWINSQGNVEYTTNYVYKCKPNLDLLYRASGVGVLSSVNRAHSAPA